MGAGGGRPFLSRPYCFLAVPAPQLMEGGGVEWIFDQDGGGGSGTDDSSEQLTVKPLSTWKSAGDKHEAKMVPRGTKQPAATALAEGHSKGTWAISRVLGAPNSSACRHVSGKPTFWPSGVRSGLG